MGTDPVKLSLNGSNPNVTVTKIECQQLLSGLFIQVNLTRRQSGRLRALRWPANQLKNCVDYYANKNWLFDMKQIRAILAMLFPAA